MPDILASARVQILTALSGVNSNGDRSGAGALAGWGSADEGWELTIDD
jgi:hypothetical protein